MVIRILIYSADIQIESVINIEILGLVHCKSGPKSVKGNVKNMICQVLGIRVCKGWTRLEGPGRKHLLSPF